MVLDAKYKKINHNSQYEVKNQEPGTRFAHQKNTLTNDQGINGNPQPP
jgi:hypothetical protein